MTNLVRRFIDDETGATAIEYGLIAAGIAVAIIVAVNAVGTDLAPWQAKTADRQLKAGNMEGTLAMKMSQILMNQREHG